MASTRTNRLDTDNRSNVSSTQRRPSHIQYLRLAGAGCSILLLGLGIVSIAGWVFDQPLLRSFWPTGAQTKFNAAICLTLIGLGLLLCHGSGKVIRRMVSICAIFVIVVCAISLAETIFSYNLGIDEMIYKDYAHIGTTHPGRMAPEGACSYILLGVGLLLLITERPSIRYRAQWVALAALPFPVQTLAGFFLGHRIVVGITPYNAYISLPAAMGMILGTISILLFDPDRDVMQPLTARTHASAVFRRLLLISIVLPPALGWLTLHLAGGQDRTAEYNVATMALVLSLLLVTFNWFQAARMNSASLALAEREHLYSRFVENLPDIVFRLDRELRHLYISPMVERISGIAPRRFIGKTNREMGLAPVVSDRLEAACRIAFRTGSEQSIEFEDKGRIFLMRVIPANLDDGDESLLGLTSDISRHRRAEMALRDATERLESILAATRVATWTWDVQKDQVFADPNLANLFSINTADAHGGSIQLYLKSIHPDDQEGVTTTVRAALASQSGLYEKDYRLIQKDGSVRWVTARGKVERDHSGMPARLAGVIMDITERHGAEERERRLKAAAVDANAKFRAVFDQSSVFAGIMTVEGVLIEANRLWLEQCGYRAEDVLKKPFWQTAWWRDSKEIQEKIHSGSRAAANGDPYRETLPYLWADGTPRLMEFGLYPIRDDQGRVIFLHPSGVDITDRSRTEEALARAKSELETINQNLGATVAERTARLQETVQELEAFSYSIAHDMRSPLRSLVGYSKILESDYGHQLDETALQYLRRLGSSAHRMDRLIIDILNYSKVVRGELNLHPVDVKKLMVDIIESYPMLQNVQSGITLADPFPLVLANEAALTQVISNLLGNAVKFVANGVEPKVRVWAQIGGEIPEGFVRLWFEDNGIGIPKESHHRMFQMFMRLNKPEVYDGTGIGLAIVKRAVERMGGSVGVESEPGRGTRMWVQLQKSADHIS